MTFLIEHRNSEDSLWMEQAYIDIAPGHFRRFVEIVDAYQPLLVRYRRVEFVPPEAVVTTLGALVQKNKHYSYPDNSANWNHDV